MTAFHSIFLLFALFLVANAVPQYSEAQLRLFNKLPGFSYEVTKKNEVAVQQPSRQGSKRAPDCSWFTSADCYSTFGLFECNGNCTCAQNFFDCVLINIKSGECSPSFYYEDCTTQTECPNTLECVDPLAIEEGICPFVAETSLSGQPPQDINLPGPCKHYSGNTCCTAEDATNIFNDEDDSFAKADGDCKDKASLMACAPCSPDSWKYYYATKETEGDVTITYTGISVCKDFCYDLYDSCKDSVPEIKIFSKEGFCDLMEKGFDGKGDSVECFALAPTLVPSILLLLAAVFAYLF